MRHTRTGYGLILSILIVIGIAASAAWAGGAALANQQTTPTPGFGPIITPGTGPTSEATPVPATPTPPPTNTAVPTITPTDAPTQTPTIAGTPLPTLRADLMGIQINPNLTEDDFNFMLWLAERLGVKWIKFQFAWEILEPQQGTLSNDFFAYRLKVQAAHQKGFRVMISIAKAPDWARASTEEDGPPRDPQLLGNFINMMQREVRVDLYGQSYFSAIEIWNEPNLRREWNGGQLGGAEYMRLFDTTYNAIRAGEGGGTITIVTAGLAPTGWNDGVTAIDDRVFLQQMYQNGLSNPAYQNIAIGVHPYGAHNPPDARCCTDQDYQQHPSWFFLDTLEDYHAIMQAAGDGSRQLWATEFGWGTWEGFVTAEGLPAPPPVDPPYFQWVTLDDQANYTVRAFEIGQGLPYLGPMMLWNLNWSNEDFIDAQDARAAYGLLSPRASPLLRPAFTLLEAVPKQ